MDPIDNKRRGVNREALTIARDYGHVLPFGVCHFGIKPVKLNYLKYENYYKQHAGEDRRDYRDASRQFGGAGAPGMPARGASGFARA